MTAFSLDQYQRFAFPAREEGQPSSPSFLRRIGSMVALLGLAVVTAASSPARADDWQLCINGQQDQVVAPCSAVIRQQARDPVERSRAYVRRGEWYRMHNRFDEAWEDMEQAERLDPNSYFAIVGHGPLLVQKGRYEEAMVLYDRAIASHPQIPYGYFLRGNVRLRQNQLAAAMEDYNQAIGLRGDFAGYYVNRGSLFSQMGDLDHAMADLDRAVSLNPGLADAFFFRGGIYRKKGDNDRAMTDMNRAIALNPRYAAAFVARGEIFNAKGDFGRAIADYDRALSIAPDSKYAQEMKQQALAAKSRLAAGNGPSHAATPRTETNPFTVVMPSNTAGLSDRGQDNKNGGPQIRLNITPLSGRPFPGAPNVPNLPGF